MIWRVLFALFLTCASAHAGGRGGVSRVFDPNFFPGGEWVCIRSQASGACGSWTFAQYFDGTCSGASDDTASNQAWKAYAFARNPLKSKLYYPPGSKCNNPSENTLTWDSPSGGGGAGVNNAVIWAYDAQIALAYFGGQHFYQDDLHSAKINTVSAGATSVVVNDGNVGRFSVGDQIMFTGDLVEVLDGGYPPAYRFYDTATVTGINSNTITFGPPLTNSYKSTWPDTALGAGMGNGGAARIYNLPPSWNTNLEVYGLTVPNPDPGSQQINIIGRNIYFQDVTILTQSLAPSGVRSMTMVRTYAPVGFEVDKNMGRIQISNSVIGQTAVQSPSPQQLIIELTDVYCSMNGTAINTIMRYVTIHASGCDGRIAIGPTLFGPGTTLSLDNVVFPLAQPSQLELPTAWVTFASGSFKVSKSAANSHIAQFFSVFVPGQKYKFGWHNSFGNACTPAGTFTVNDLSEDATDYIASTDIVGSLPTPDCSARGTEETMYVAYPISTITQTGNTSGSPNITGYSAP